MSCLFYPLFIISLQACCALFFAVVQKPLFYLMNRSAAGKKSGWRDFPEVLRHGIRSDLIIAAYFAALPLFAGYAATLIRGFHVGWLLYTYIGIFALAVALTTVGDTALYRFWQAKIDSSVFPYLRHPKGAFASVSTAYVVTAAACVLILAALFAAGPVLLTILFTPLLPQPLRPVPIVADTLMMLLMAGGCYAMIRGLGIRPNNPSIAYFSPVSFRNHWAVNPVYNLIYSMGLKDEYRGRFVWFDEERRRELFDPMFPTAGEPERILLRTRRPDILTIVWESFSGRFCGETGGDPEVTPEFNALCREGILFAGCRASSFRTDRALPAIFCGLPGQPTASVVRHTRKLAGLTGFPGILRDSGYTTMAMHGGDLSIMHKSDFYLASGHSTLISESDMPKGLEKCRWGVHDGPMADRVGDAVMELAAAGKPWLISWQTLSSHEPFTVPYARLDNEEKNAMAYTDAAVGSLMRRLKSSPAWDNLLVIIVADHSLGVRNEGVTNEENSHIPMLWTGGAVLKPERLDLLMSQADIAGTLLGQMGIPHGRFPFSRDVLAGSYSEPSAIHSYSNGVVFADRSGFTDFSTVSMEPDPVTADTGRMDRAKAILQTLYSYIAKL